jgi:mono/diheme cytochrome c family protein
MNMKQLFIISSLIASGVALIGCGGANGEDPGRIYMPDMTYSRAYETYGYNTNPEDHDLKSRNARYTGAPVPGTMARGDVFTFPIPGGDSGYAQSASYISPLPTMTITAPQMKEAERLYLINCGICHGTALDGNGPLWNGGEGPYPAAPKNLLDEYSKKLSDGQIYHVITYGKGQMGSYAAQVHPEQRWWITAYIRNKQGNTKTAGIDSTAIAPATGANGTTTTSNAPAASTGTTTSN